MKEKVPGKIETLEDVNNTLGEIGTLECELNAIGLEEQMIINAAKKDAEKHSAPLREKIDAYSRRIEVFAQEHKKDLFTDKKSFSLSFGSFGFRKTVSIDVSPKTVHLLKKLKLDKYIRVTIKEEPRKELLKEMDDASLARVKARRVTEEKFFVKADVEESNKNLKEAG
jgi:phage host-nuclease inhibitor protein Gam